MPGHLFFKMETIILPKHIQNKELHVSIGTASGIIQGSKTENGPQTSDPRTNNW